MIMIQTRKKLTEEEQDELEFILSTTGEGGKVYSDVHILLKEREDTEKAQIAEMRYRLQLLKSIKAKIV